MNARETRDQENERTHPTQGATWKFVRLVALLVGSGATIVGCAADSDDPELADSDQALMASTNESDVSVASKSKRQVAAVQPTSAASWTAVQTSGPKVFGTGTIVVAFTRDPDGAWHCVGDADCNKMFLAGVCQGGILDSSCDTTSGVECWCY